jgi:hypothetical protein
MDSEYLNAIFNDRSLLLSDFHRPFPPNTSSLSSHRPKSNRFHVREAIPRFPPSRVKRFYHEGSGKIRMGVQNSESTAARLAERDYRFSGCIYQHGWEVDQASIPWRNFSCSMPQYTRIRGVSIQANEPDLIIVKYDLCAITPSECGRIRE